MTQKPACDDRFPSHLYYDPGSHLWIAADPATGSLRLGLDELNVLSYGDLVYISLPAPGDRLERGRPIGALEAAKMVGSLVAPVSGIVLDVNPRLRSDPALINQDPYGEGWLLTLRPDDWEGESAGLVHGPEVEAWAQQEIHKFDEQDGAGWLAGA